MNSLLKLPEIQLPEASIVAKPVEVTVPDEPLVKNKSQATRMAKQLFGPKARWYKNRLRRVTADVPGGTWTLTQGWFGIPEDHVVLTLDHGAWREVLGHGKNYDTVIQELMKEKK